MLMSNLQSMLLMPSVPNGCPDREWAIGEHGVVRKGIINILVTIIDMYEDGSYEVEVWLSGTTLTVKSEHIRPNNYEEKRLNSKKNRKLK